MLARRRFHRTRRLLPVLGAALLLALALTLPATALAAGHIQSFFSTTMSPDPNPGVTGVADPQIGGDTVSYRVYDINGDDWGYVWTIGDPASVEKPEFMASFRDGSGPLQAYLVYSGRSIYVWDGLTSHVVLNAAPRHIDHVSISGNTVVWADHRNGNWDIYGAHLDPATHELLDEFPVCTAAGNQINPDVGGNWVVWQDKRDGEYDVWGRNLATGHTQAICRNGEAQDSPATDGSHVVWVDWRSHATGADIYGYTLSSHVTRVVCHALKTQKEPDIANGFVVWTDFSKVNPDLVMANSNVYGYDWPSRTTFGIAVGPGEQAEPDIDGSKVVWVDHTYTDMGGRFGMTLGGAVLQH